MKVLALLVALILLLVLAFILFASYRTYKTERSPNQEVFAKGIVEIASLNGEYRGKVRGYEGSWQGKTFNQADNSGINRFVEEGTVVPKYPFATRVAKGLRDKTVDVVVLDYNQPGNPWWLRFIVDEMVSIAPDTYLGKVHIRVAPGVVFSMGYFTLEKV